MPGGGSSSGAIAATGGNDTLAGSGSFAAFGTIAATEGADQPGILGWCITALVAATEGHDSPAIPGLLTTAGSAAITAGTDSPSIAGLLTSSGSLTGTGGTDSFSATGLFTDPGAIAPTGGNDSPSFSGGFLTAGSAAVTAGNDSPSFGGFCGSLATAGITEGADSPSFSGGFLAPGSTGLAGVAERHDAFAGSATFAAAATMGVVEGHDAFGSFSSDLEYHIYSNTGIADPINYASAIATTSLLTWTSSALTYPGTWSFGVRAFDPVSGLEEENLDAAVTIILDASGVDISQRPKPPLALRAFPTAGGGIRVEWAYNTINPAPIPTGFHVYQGTGGMPSYGSPAATVSFAAAIAGTFVANLAGLSNGIAYTIGVRAYNATAEEPNTVTVTVTADSAGPSAVVSLTATAIV